jgi:hypothetical protein
MESVAQLMTNSFCDLIVSHHPVLLDAIEPAPLL